MVLLQPLHVGLQGLCGLVPPPGIHGDSNGPGKLLVDAGELRGEEEREVSASHSCQQPGREPTTPPTKGLLVLVLKVDFCRWISPKKQSATPCRTHLNLDSDRHL